MKTYSRILSCLLSSVFSGLLLFSANAQAANLTLSQVPLFLGGSVDPNIMFTLDDSGSMHWEVMPDNVLYTYYVFPRASGIYGAGDYTNYVPGFDVGNRFNSFLRSSSNNKIYYDPTLRYLPWANSDGTLFPNANPACAPHNPFDPAKGCRDLTQNNTESARWRNDDSTFTTQTRTFWPATYFRYNTGNAFTYTNYTRVEIRPDSTYTGGPNRTDCTGAAGAPLVCRYPEELQNFANWYTYDRSRILLSRSGVGRAFSQQGNNMRVGFAAINEGAATIDGVSGPGTLVRGLRQFSGTDRDNFFDDLYGHVMPTAGTPLRRALDDVGKYFERTDNRGPWSATPGTSNSTAHLSCRQSFHVMMTDGFWNSSAARTSAATANVDNNSGPSIFHPTDPLQNYQYLASNPYKDAYGNTLADVGMYYWYRDLRTDLDNNVPPNAADPAYWQHLVNFTVGLGVFGNLNPLTDLPNLTNGSKTWPNPHLTSTAKIDDLWHTAVNSRGEFFSASNPTQFATSLANVLNNIVSRTGSSAAPSLNSGSIGSDSHLYQAKFNSGNWTGELIALPINADGTLGAQSWEASAVISTQNFDTDREIISFDPVTGLGIPFRHASLNPAQQAALDINPATVLADGRSAERVNFLRGDSALEAQNNGPFRNRTSLVGDIVNSGPVFVGGANDIYPDKWDDLTGVSPSTPENLKPYSNFRNTYFTRQRIVYFGANDGLLHGVDAGTYDAVAKTFSTGTGREEIAYAPAKLLDEMNRLTDINYNHRYYVDASTTVVEGFFAGDWHTVLGGGYAAGGQGVYALDVTDPSTFDEANAANLVLWEFTDADDPDLGNTYGQPINVVRMHNGKWAALFSNGYNNTEPDGNVSATGNAVLFIVDLETGNLIRKIDTLQGSAQDPTFLGKPNGLSVAAPVDRDGDFIIDAAYAGDLFGNLWKFDLSDPDPANWGVAYGGNPLFLTRQTGGIRQPITVRPQIGEAPHGSETGTVNAAGLYDPAGGAPLLGSVVYFGTGKFFEVGDGIAVGQDTQTFYAVWDKQIPSNDPDYSAPPFIDDQLLTQEIYKEIDTTDPTNPFGVDLRLTTSESVDWHLNAGYPSGSPVTTHLGWKMDMIDMGTSPLQNYGERMVSRPVLRAGRIIFTTLIPDPDPCGDGGTGWLMELDAESGSTLTFSPFDLNHDTNFDGNDLIAVSNTPGAQRVPVSGKRSTIGIISTPGILDAGDQQTEFKYTSGSSGGIEITTENSGGSVGRLNWQQL